MLLMHLCGLAPVFSSFKTKTWLSIAWVQGGLGGLLQLDLARHVYLKLDHVMKSVIVFINLIINFINLIVKMYFIKSNFCHFLHVTF